MRASGSGRSPIATLIFGSKHSTLLGWIRCPHWPVPFPPTTMASTSQEAPPCPLLHHRPLCPSSTNPRACCCTCATSRYGHHRDALRAADRRALLIHDTVPGGTGYLAEFADHTKVWAVLAAARQIVRDCPTALKLLDDILDVEPDATPDLDALLGVRSASQGAPAAPVRRWSRSTVRVD
jgi:hypothetical protein